MGGACLSGGRGGVAVGVVVARVLNFRFFLRPIHFEVKRGQDEETQTGWIAAARGVLALAVAHLLGGGSSG